MNKDTGWPAFPHTYFDVQLGKTRVMQGMTLRDYFATKAMQGLLASDVSAAPEEFAKHSYEMADAMLAERKK